MDELDALCARWMGRPLPDALCRDLEPLLDDIEGRHPGALAILLYGSCLRDGRLEGVPDFLLVVADYTRAYAKATLRAANRWCPPNVFALIAEDGESGPLRAKYAVLSLDDLHRATATNRAHCFVWARLCQPVALLRARDDEVRDALARCAATSVEAMMTVALPRAVDADTPVDASAATLWETGLRETYRAEWRFETTTRSAEIVAGDADYYGLAASAAIARLETRGALRREGATLRLDPAWARRERWRWALRRPLGKAAAALRLLKSAFTFGDWVPYALWKMERHTGVRVDASPAQRRHPFLLGWPVLWRALRQRLLR